MIQTSEAFKWQTSWGETVRTACPGWRSSVCTQPFMEGQVKQTEEEVKEKKQHLYSFVSREKSTLRMIWAAGREASAQPVYQHLFLTQLGHLYTEDKRGTNLCFVAWYLMTVWMWQICFLFLIWPRFCSICGTQSDTYPTFFKWTTVWTDMLHFIQLLYHLR